MREKRPRLNEPIKTHRVPWPQPTREAQNDSPFPFRQTEGVGKVMTKERRDGPPLDGPVITNMKFGKAPLPMPTIQQPLGGIVPWKWHDQTTLLSMRYSRRL